MINTIASIDIQPVLDSYNLLEKDIQWTDSGHKGKQAGLQYKDPLNPWDCGNNQTKGSKLSYTNLNPFFKDTIFEELINQYYLIRTRLMIVGPYACYSMHTDTTPRIHIPLITNPDCYFVFKKGIIQHLSVGSIYWADTTQAHTFINCSDRPRLHLVGIVNK
jgi:hypothetical protein